MEFGGFDGQATASELAQNQDDTQSLLTSCGATPSGEAVNGFVQTRSGHSLCILLMGTAVDEHDCW